MSSYQYQDEMPSYIEFLLSKGPPQSQSCLLPHLACILKQALWLHPADVNCCNKDIVKRRTQGTQLTRCQASIYFYYVLPCKYVNRVSCLKEMLSSPPVGGLVISMCHGKYLKCNDFHLVYLGASISRLILAGILTPTQAMLIEIFSGFILNLSRTNMCSLCLFQLFTLTSEAESQKMACSCSQLNNPKRLNSSRTTWFCPRNVKNIHLKLKQSKKAYL